jgi:Fic family protein
MLKIISAIEAKRLYFSSLNIPIPIQKKIKRTSLLKSSLFSARIEGNPLLLTDLNKIQTEKEKKLEVFNIEKAMHFIDSKNIKEITKDFIIELHRLVLKDLSSGAGKIRCEVSAIFNPAGIAVYMPPPPSDIDKLLNELISYIKNDSEDFPLITAFIAHLIFEKIHPFLDGNGRVGRLLIGAVLKRKGWSFSLTVPFEEYLDENREEYYYRLDNGLRSTNDYLTFMLKAFLNQIERTKGLIEKEISKEHPFLPPRQEEIFEIIKDHNTASFDMIKRRFLKVPPRTLRYDIKKLVDRGLLEKTGTTRGVYYRVKNS